MNLRVYRTDHYILAYYCNGCRNGVARMPGNRCDGCTQLAQQLKKRVV